MRAIETVFQEAGVELPPRRLVTIGTVSVDEPLLAVMYGGTSVGTPGNEMTVPMRQEQPRSATWNVELWRSQPILGAGGRIPTPEQERDAAETIMNDQWLLIQSAYAADQMGVGVIARVGVNEPQGGTVGSSMSLELQIP